MRQSLLKRIPERYAAKLISKRRLISSGTLTVIVGVAYFFAARLGLFLLTEPDGVAVFWPAAGVSSGILIALGRDLRWPVAVGVVAATVAANLTSDRNIWAAIAFGLCNVGEALLAAWLIERYVGGVFRLSRLRHVLYLLVVAIVATAVSGIAGTVGYELFHSSDVPALTIWQHWFLSDAIGIITVAPLIIGLAWVARERSPPREAVEGVAAVISAAAAITVIIFVLPNAWWSGIGPVELLFPVILWLAARCRPAFTAVAVFVVSLTIVTALTFRLGHFGDAASSIEEPVFVTQAGIVGVAIFALVLAALFAERRWNVIAITERENRTRAIVNTVVDGIITIDDQGTIESLNPAAARIFGYNPDEIIGRNVKTLMPEFYGGGGRELHGDVRTGQGETNKFWREVTGKRKDGSTVPVEIAVSDTQLIGRSMFTGVVRDITERKRAEEHQELLIAELDHRVKNILAQVAVVATSTRQASRSIDDFVQSLDGRIQSMAAAHTLLSKSGWQSVGFKSLVRNQLAPYATGANVTVSGAHVMLESAVIQAVARVLHELATNAAKYGALSSPEGRVFLTWERQSSGSATNLTIFWRERGGPPVPPVVQPSYGTNLIRNLIPHELGGAVDLLFATAGVSCKIEIPIRQARHDGERS
jgi:PAS domain S-box-containing protein